MGQPVTGVLIVNDPSRCPLDYNPIKETYDTHEDADLYNVFLKRERRYICISHRSHNEDGSLRPVVVDLSVINEKDDVPNGFRCDEFTHDSKEKVLKKKKLAVKYTPLDASIKTAVTEIIILSKSKRPPMNFTLAGETNGFSVCYKMGLVNAYTTPVPASLLQPHARESSPAKPPPPQIPAPAAFHNATMGRHRNPLSSVPFEINKKYAVETNKENTHVDVNYKSIHQIDNEYKFDFQYEEGLLRSS